LEKVTGNWQFLHLPQVIGWLFQLCAGLHPVAGIAQALHPQLGQLCFYQYLWQLVSNYVALINLGQLFCMK
jgi:hypothetical protein